MTMFAALSSLSALSPHDGETADAFSVRVRKTSREAARQQTCRCCSGFSARQRQNGVREARLAVA